VKEKAEKVLCFLCSASLRCCAQILELYKQYIDPEFSWSNFSLEEQAKVIVAPRSNNLLDTQRVSGLGLQASGRRGGFLQQ
jgi:hypothetical protein